MYDEKEDKEEEEKKKEEEEEDEEEEEEEEEEDDGHKNVKSKKNNYTPSTKATSLSNSKLSRLPNQAFAAFLGLGEDHTSLRRQSVQFATYLEAGVFRYMQGLVL